MFNDSYMRKEGGAKWHSQTARPTLDSSGVVVVTLSHLTEVQSLSDIVTTSGQGQNGHDIQ